MDETPRSDEETTDEPRTRSATHSGSGPWGTYRGRRLLRSADERMLAGVAGGLGRYLDVDPTLIRIGFVVAALLGGLGLAAYLILALVVPKDDGTGSPSTERRSPWGIALILIALLVVLPGPFGPPFLWENGWWWGWGAMIWLAAIGGVSYIGYLLLRDRGPRGESEAGGDDATAPAAPEDTPTTAASAGAETQSLAAPASNPRRPSEPAAETPSRSRASKTSAVILRVIALVMLGLALALGALGVATLSAWLAATGSGAVVAGVVIAIGAGLVALAFIGGARWLVLPALLLALPAGAVAATDYELDSGIGERSHRPSGVAQIPADGYRLGIGELVVDLRDLDLERGERVETSAKIGLGRLIVSVPADACVEATADVGAGEALVRGESSDGLDATLDVDPPAGKAPRLLIDADADAGQIVITDSSPDAVERGRARASSADADAARAACAR